jgi:hypothetical protein
MGKSVSTDSCKVISRSYHSPGFCIDVKTGAFLCLLSNTFKCSHVTHRKSIGYPLVMIIKNNYAGHLLHYFE